MRAEDDDFVEGGEDNGGCGFSLAFQPWFACTVAFFPFGAASVFVFGVAAVVFFFCGAAFVFPGFDLITGVNRVEERDVNNVQLVLSIADCVATFDALGLTFFFVEILVVNPLFNLFGVDERVYSALWDIGRSVIVCLIWSLYSLQRIGGLSRSYSMMNKGVVDASADRDASMLLWLLNLELL